nr:hypothetical protein Iba_scaffold14370CG0160 [Ipomoea batatas]
MLEEEISFACFGMYCWAFNGLRWAASMAKVFQIVMMGRKVGSVIDYLAGDMHISSRLLSFLLLMDLLGALGRLQELKIAWCAMVIPLDCNLYM